MLLGNGKAMQSPGQFKHSLQTSASGNKMSIFIVQTANMDWNEILKYFISITVITGAISFIIKTLFTKFIDAGIEKYKIGLNKDLELYKSDLARINTEHQIKYNKLYEQRGEKIQMLYTSIFELEKKLTFLTSSFQGSEWTADTLRSKDVKHHLDKLNELLELNRIYFSDSLCEKIELIIKESWSIERMMNKAKMTQKKQDYLIEHGRGDNIQNPMDPLNIWSEAEINVQDKINQARLELVKEFHAIIGVK